MTGWLTADVGQLFGDGATVQESYGLLSIDVPPASWITALRTARSELDCTYFDWLSAVDEPDIGFRVSAHVVALGPVRRLLLRTTVPYDTPVLASAVEVYAGASWHERETHEMFGIDFEGHPHLVPLLLPDGFEGHPLRKDFVLAARVVKAWPGAKEPGESEHGGPRRRQMLPPGVPDPNEWGPHKGTLPAAPARPARGARGARAGGEASAGPAGPGRDRAPDSAPRATRERRPRRMRTAAEGSVSQSARPSAPPSEAARGSSGTSGATEDSGAMEVPGAADAPVAQGVTAGGGPAPVPVSPGTPETPEASKEPETPKAPETPETPKAPETPETPETPKAPETPETPKAPEASDGPEGPEPTPRETARRTRARSSDAPWHHARPTFDERRPNGPEGPTDPAHPIRPTDPDSPAADGTTSDSTTSDGTTSDSAAQDSAARDSAARDGTAEDGDSSRGGSR